jgi:hypothetical protein
MVLPFRLRVAAAGFPENKSGTRQPASGKLPPKDMDAPEFELNGDPAIWRAYDPAVEKQLTDARHGIRDFAASLPGEQMQAVNLMTGQRLPPLRSKLGEPHKIDVSEQIAALVELGGPWALLHNHEDNSSFSRADLGLFLAHGELQELRVLTPRYEFMVRKTDRTTAPKKGLQAQIKAEFSALEAQLQDKYDALLLQTDLSRRALDDLWERRFHDINLALAQRHGYLYAVRAKP